MSVPAHEFLETAAAHLKERGKTYDVNGTEERSINKTVDMFKALTGVQLSYEQGWLFMACLKMVRTQQNDVFHKDSFEDCCAYMALAGEASSEKIKKTKPYPAAESIVFLGRFEEVPTIWGKFKWGDTITSGEFVYKYGKDDKWHTEFEYNILNIDWTLEYTRECEAVDKINAKK